MRRMLCGVLAGSMLLAGCATGHPPRPDTHVYRQQPVYQPAPPTYTPPPQPGYQSPPPPPPPRQRAYQQPPPVYQQSPPAYTPPPQSVDPNQQQVRDTEECKQWAYQQTGFEPGKDAVTGAAVGGVLGALGGAAAGAAIGAIAKGGC